MIRNKYAAFGLFAALVLVFWNLFDWLYASFVTGSGYSFGAAGANSPQGLQIPRAALYNLNN